MIYEIFDESNLNVQLQQIVPVSAALSDEQIVPSLDSAVELFILPVLGEATLNALIACVASPTDTQLRALRLLRRAVVNLALWYNFHELNVHITDQGFQRQESESFKGVYRYQEIELRQSFKNKGFNSIDALIVYLNAHLTTFTTWSSAPGYVERDKALVKGPDEIGDFSMINGSYLVYLTLLPQFAVQLDTVVEPAIGTKAVEFLRAYLNGDFDGDTTKAALGEKLRLAVVKVVVLGALANHVRNIGEITDRGLYYRAIAANTSQVESVDAARDSERARQSAQFMQEKHHYMHRLTSFVKTEMYDMYVGDPHDVHNRHNDHKHTFWA